MNELEQEIERRKSAEAIVSEITEVKMSKWHDRSKEHMAKYDPPDPLYEKFEAYMVNSEQGDEEEIKSLFDALKYEGLFTMALDELKPKIDRADISPSVKILLVEWIREIGAKYRTEV